MIVTAVDYTYLRREGTYLIKSCWKHAPEQRFYLYLVNAPKEIDAELNQWHGNIIVEHREYPVSPETWKGVMCCARTIPLQHVLHKYREPTIYLDSDVIVKRPLTQLFSLLEQHDLAVLLREQSRIVGPLGTEHAYKFNSGVIGIKPSPYGLEFVQRYCDFIQTKIKAGAAIDHTDQGVYTALDQEYLYVLYQEMSDRIKFQALSETFNDSEFKPGSVVWHGKGNTRSQYVYKREKADYDANYSKYIFYSGVSHAQATLERGKRKLKSIILRKNSTKAAI
ncbi:MAG: hypothetical protein KTR17_04815 [Cellvibrionaceae bacterium]|nr:hypothetical protein [Cellvibrionaceae bacterium]